MANLGYRIADQTIGNILKRHSSGTAPDRRRNTTWADFIRRHKEVLWATDFFTTEVWTCSGLTTFYVLFCLHLQTRKVVLGGMTPYPQEAWLKQVARNLPVADGPLTNARFLLHDRDTKFSDAFDEILRDAGVTAIRLPPPYPNLNAFAERWVRSVKPPKPLAWECRLLHPLGVSSPPGLFRWGYNVIPPARAPRNVLVIDIARFCFRGSKKAQP